MDKEIKRKTLLATKDSLKFLSKTRLIRLTELIRLVEEFYDPVLYVEGNITENKILFKYKKDDSFYMILDNNFREAYYSKIQNEIKHAIENNIASLKRIDSLIEKEQGLINKLKR